MRIDKPCSQDWNSMEEDEKGRFCSQCSKTVIDFTQLSDAQILRLLDNNSGSICGRLATNQLNRDIETKSRSQNSIFYKFLTGLFLLVGNHSVGKPAIKIDVKNEIIPKSFIDLTVQKNKQMPLIDTTKMKIRGLMADSLSKAPIQGAAIIIKNTNIGILSIVDGSFELSIPEKFQETVMSFTISAVGYYDKEINISITDNSTFTTVFLRPKEVVLAGAIYVAVKRKWWQKRRKNKQ